MARHTHEDALSDAEFEKLVDGAKVLEPPWNLEALFAVLVAGRLGLRIGEIAHARREWLSDEEGARRAVHVITHKQYERIY